MVFLCQPNNPTGQLTPLPLVEALLHRCEACGALLVVDECFLDFLPESEVLSAKKLLASPNLIILKAFTKLYGMAGVRLGYCLCSNTALLEKMQTAGQPWAVSSLAQAAGLAALDETAYVTRVQALIAQQRPVLRDGLRWGCGCWMVARIICCFRHRKRWATSCGSAVSCCAAAATTPDWTAAGTALPCAPRRKTSSL